MITYDDFKKLEFKAATIVGAEVVPASDKLLKLQIDLGGEKRQLVAGIAKSYPDLTALIGKQIVVLTNLEPKILRGLESQGMLLAADGLEGPVLLVPERMVSPGSIIK